MEKKVRISIVEDDTKKLNTLRNKINKKENMVCISTYETAEDAIVGLPKDQTEIVLMDIGLPNMNGVECMFMVKQKCPDLTFLMYTIWANDENVFDAIRFGADGYILKREGVTGILKAIHDYLAGGAPMSPEIARKILLSFRTRNTENLTPRQIEILEHVSKGLQNKEIGDKLFIAEGSVKVQLARIYKKLQVNNRMEAVNKYKGRNNS